MSRLPTPSILDPLMNDNVFYVDGTVLLPSVTTVRLVDDELLIVRETNGVATGAEITVPTNWTMADVLKAVASNLAKRVEAREPIPRAQFEALREAVGEIGIHLDWMEERT